MSERTSLGAIRMSPLPGAVSPAMAPHGAPETHAARSRRVLLLDSRDSFTFNIAQACLELGVVVDVIDADDVSGDAIVAAYDAGRGPDVVVVGPGPRGPAQLPHLVDVVGALDGRVPLFGVCLGLQALVCARGGRVGRAVAPMHGKRDAISHDGSGCLAGLPSPLWVMRYHSLVATSVPETLHVSARDAAGQVMAVVDVAAGVEAVQFHPESIGCAGGMAILARALGVAHRTARRGAVPDVDDVGPAFSHVASRDVSALPGLAPRLQSA